MASVATGVGKFSNIAARATSIHRRLFHEKDVREDLESHLPTNANMINRFGVICRFCLEEKAVLINIFRWSDRAAVMLESLVGIKIEEDDMLPKQVCADCYKLLNQCLSFKEQVASADTALRQCFDQLNQVEIGTKEEVFEAYDPGITNQHVFNAISTMNELNESYKIEDLIEEGYTAGDERVWENDANLYSVEDRKPVSDDGDIVYSPENKSEPITNSIAVISCPSKGQPKSRKSVNCEQCGEAFSSNSHMQSHIKTHVTKNLKNQCRFRNNSFCQETELKDHMHSHKSPHEDTEEQTKAFECQKGNASFAVERDSYIHDSIDAENDRIHCRDCNKDFSKLINLQRHVKTHYKDKPRCMKERIRRHVPKIILPVCQKSFTDRSKLTNHISLNAGRKLFVCKVCNKSFKLKCTFLVHLRLHTGEKPYKCPHCSKSFASSSALTSHVRIHTGEKPYKCSECSKSFRLQSAMVGHVRTHTGEKPYQCPHCSKSFAVRCSLVVHVRTHTGEKPYKCPHCSVSYISSSALADHVRRHTGEKPYKCPHCSKSFGNASGLPSHLRTHTGEKPYKCSYCLKSFRNSSGLTGHIRTHTGEKPYKCNHCPKSFSASRGLICHVRTHTGEKPYKCNHCPKSFSNATGLIVHVRRHMGEKPYKCPQCPKSFSDLSGLNVHARTHTGEKPS